VGTTKAAVQGEEQLAADCIDPIPLNSDKFAGPDSMVGERAHLEDVSEPKTSIAHVTLIETKADELSDAKGCELGRVDSVQGLEVRPTNYSETGSVDCLNADISTTDLRGSRLDCTATRLQEEGNGPDVLRGEQEAVGTRLGREKQSSTCVCIIDNSRSISDSQLPLATDSRCWACARKERLSDLTKASKQTDKKNTKRKHATVPDEAETQSKMLQDVREEKAIQGDRVKIPVFRRPTLPAPGPAKPHIIKRPQWLDDLNDQYQSNIAEQEERERVRKELEHKREVSFLNRWARVLSNADASESAFLSPRIHSQDRADDGEDEVMVHTRKVWGLQQIRLKDLRSTCSALPLEGTFLARLTEDTSSGRTTTTRVEVGELQPCRALESRSKQGRRKLENVFRFNIGAPEKSTYRMKILTGIYENHPSL
jgi:hypothetical protein